MSVSHDEPTTKLTYDDYVLFPHDGNRHEIINERHYLNAAPNPRHQTVSRLLQFLLMQQIEISGHGQVFDAPIDLQLGTSDVVQPDLVVVMNDKRIVTPTKIMGTPQLGVPDLVVEILSKSTRANDEQLKKRLYEQSRIPEYWILDGDGLRVLQFRLGADGNYGEPVECVDEITFTCDAVTAVVDLAKVW